MCSDINTNVEVMDKYHHDFKYFVHTLRIKVLSAPLINISRKQEALYC